MKVYAHRGYSGRYPENTMPAFEMAYEAGCDGIELDVQLTKDGEVVIIHDETIDRTTDGCGYVRDYNLCDLQKFDATKVKPLKTKSFVNIPTLREYLEWAKDKNITTNIEIKSGVYYYEGLEELSYNLVKEYDLESKVIFSSFNHMSIIDIKRINPKMRVGALVEHEGLENAAYYCKKFGFEFFHPGHKCLKDKDAVDCINNNVGINVWTINDMDVLTRMCELGVDGVITNYPDICRAYIRSHKINK